MPIRIVRLGTPRAKGEGLRLGTVRRPPRGVPKNHIAFRNYYDAWLPELAPSAALVSWAMASPWTPARWRRFVQRYRTEMRAPAARHLLEALAALSHQTGFALGCYCEDASRCHRSVLADLLRAHGADLDPAEDAADPVAALRPARRRPRRRAPRPRRAARS